MNKSYLLATLCLSLLPFSFCHAAESSAVIGSIKTLNAMGSMHQDYGQIEKQLFARIDTLDNPKILLMGEAFGRLTKKIFAHLQASKKSAEIYVNDLDPRHIAAIRQWAEVNAHSDIQILFIEGDINEKLPELIRAKKSEYFDIITAFSLLHFFKPPQIGDHLTNVYLALKKGGAAYYAFMTPESLKDYSYLKNFVPSFSSLDDLKKMTAYLLLQRRKYPTLEAALKKYSNSHVDEVLCDHVTMKLIDFYRPVLEEKPKFVAEATFKILYDEMVLNILHDIHRLKRSYIYVLNKEHQVPFPGAFYKEDPFFTKTYRFLGGILQFEDIGDETYLDQSTFRALVARFYKIIFMQPFSIGEGIAEERADGMDLACIIEKPLTASINGLEIQVTPLDKDPIKKLHLDCHSGYEMSHEVRYCAPHYTFSKKKIVSPTPVPTCDNCAKASAKLLTCTRCKKARYCNAECQRKDWPHHKNVCCAPGVSKD